MNSLPSNNFEIEKRVERVDLNDWLSGGSDAALLLRIHGETSEGINNGDWVMVDCERLPRNGDLIVNQLAEGYSICRAKRSLYLVGEEFQESQNPLGVITFVIREVTR